MKCLICNKELADMHSLASHSRAAHHLTKEEYNNLYHKKEITDDMIQCKICNEYCKPLGFPSHARRKHNLSVKEYYDKYIRQPNEGLCVTCGKETPFIGITKGYRAHCSEKCSRNDPKVQEKIMIHVIKYDDDFKNNTDFCIEKPHVYRYDFDYKGKMYHYVGSTIHSQVSRTLSNYHHIIKSKIKEMGGRKEFLVKYCKIVAWFEPDQKIEMTDLEEKLNIEAKKEFGEEFVLSINNGRKPSKQCIEAAAKAQKQNGSWNKGLKLSEKHKAAISTSMSKRNVRYGLLNIKAYIEDYKDGKVNDLYRICRYLNNKYSANLTKSTITTEDIDHYYSIICNDIEEI